jgi:hypothetical protein
MAHASPEINMAILANVAEMTRLTVSSMMSNENVRNLFGMPAARENVYAAAVLAVNKKLSGRIRNLPGGQFNKSVLQGKHQSGAGTPNVSA